MIIFRNYNKPKHKMLRLTKEISTAMKYSLLAQCPKSRKSPRSNADKVCT